MLHVVTQIGHDIFMVVGQVHDRFLGLYTAQYMRRDHANNASTGT